MEFSNQVLSGFSSAYSVSRSYYVNRNTGNLTTDIKNTLVQDEDNVAFKRKFCATGISEVESPMKRISAMQEDLPYKGKTQLDRANNSIDYGEGAAISLKSGYSIVLKSCGWEVACGDPDDNEADSLAQKLAINMTNLLKYAEHQFQNPTATEGEMEEWSECVLEGLGISGIDTSRTFIVNGMEFTVENGIVKSTEKIKSEQAAKDAYNILQVQNKMFSSCSEDMRNKIDYFFDYYCSNVPETFKEVFYDTMAECDVNPFANNSCAIPKMSYEMDVATGGNKDIFGSSIESAKEGVNKLIQFLEQHGSMDIEFDNKQKAFFERLLDKI